MGHANEQAEQSKPYRAPNPGPATSNYHANDRNDDEDEEPVPAAEADDDNLEIDPSLMNQTFEMDIARQEQEKEQQLQRDRRDQEKHDSRKKEAEKPGLEAIEDIQILDLHSSRPIISYRGRVFEGQWAEVIGTEMILADHDKNKPKLPALRNLSGDVDLIAASASRILTAEKVLKTKQPEQDSLAEINKEWLINIPRGIDRSGERAQQANFLERLIALKLKKGETDHVTVYSKEAIGKDFRDHRDPDVRPRRKKMLDRDAELDDDGQPIRKRRRARRSLGSLAPQYQREDRGFGHDQTLSVSDPIRWKDTGVETEEEDDDGENGHRNGRNDGHRDDPSDSSDDIDEDGLGMNDTDDMSQGSAGNQQTEDDDDDDEDEDEDLDDYDNRDDKGKRVAWRT